MKKKNNILLRMILLVTVLSATSLFAMERPDSPNSSALELSLLSGASRSVRITAGAPADAQTGSARAQGATASRETEERLSLPVRICRAFSKWCSACCETVLSDCFDTDSEARYGSFRGLIASDIADKRVFFMSEEIFEEIMKNNPIRLLNRARMRQPVTLHETDTPDLVVRALEQYMDNRTTESDPISIYTELSPFLGETKTITYYLPEALSTEMDAENPDDLTYLTTFLDLIK